MQQNMRGFFKIRRTAGSVILKKAHSPFSVTFKVFSNTPRGLKKPSILFFCMVLHNCNEFQYLLHKDSMIDLKIILPWAGSLWSLSIETPFPGVMVSFFLRGYHDYQCIKRQVFADPA